MITKQNLIDFEQDIASIYKTGTIKGVIHLRDGNEDKLIQIFEDITKEDYVFSTWGNHLHCLLKGVPSDKVKARILEGESMAMNFPEYNFYTSAIVGGICPIATGVAWAIKRQNKNNRVFCFVGEMGFRTGICNESIMYSISHSLPITFIVEDNDKSVCTKTSDVWKHTTELYNFYHKLSFTGQCRIRIYRYKLNYPHSGCGEFVEF